MSAGDVETVSRELRAAGIVGAGGAGFPTYAKHRRSHRWFIINGADSEPGYKKDRLLLTAHPQAFERAFSLLADRFGCEVLLGLKRSHRDDWRHREGTWPIRWVSDAYWAGEARHMASEILGVPLRIGHRCSDIGAVVNCVETVYNIVQALDLGRPVTHKHLQVYGAVAEPRAYRAPVGTYFSDLARRVGVDADREPRRLVLTGGPMMGTRARLDGGAVTCTTNDLFVAPDDFAGRVMAVTPTWEHRSNVIARMLGIEEYVDRAERELQAFEDISGEVDRVRLFLRQSGSFGERAKPVVRVGQRVTVGQRVADASGELGVPVHASIEGYVTDVTSDAVVIHRDPPTRQSWSSGRSAVPEDDGRRAWRSWTRVWQRAAEAAVPDGAQLGGIVGRALVGAAEELALTPAWETLLAPGGDEAMAARLRRHVWEILGWVDGATEPESWFGRAPRLRAIHAELLGMPPAVLNAVSLYVHTWLDTVEASRALPAESGVVPLVGDDAYLARIVALLPEFTHGRGVRSAGALEVRECLRVRLARWSGGGAIPAADAPEVAGAPVDEGLPGAIRLLITLGVPPGTVPRAGPEGLVG